MAWMDDLELSDDNKPLAAKYNSLDECLTGHRNSESRLGNSIRIPGPDAPDEDVTAYHQKLINLDSKLMEKPDLTGGDQTETFYRSIGKPEAAEGYTGLEMTNLSDELQTQMKEVAFNANMTSNQFKRWATDLDEKNTATVTSLTEQAEAEMGELKTKWGMTFDERNAAAKKVQDETGLYGGREFDSLNSAERESLYNVHVSLTGKGAQAFDQPMSQSQAITPEEATLRCEEMSRKAHDRNNDLSPLERRNLIDQVIKMKQKYIPRFSNGA